MNKCWVELSLPAQCRAQDEVETQKQAKNRLQQISNSSYANIFIQQNYAWYENNYFRYQYGIYLIKSIFMMPRRSAWKLPSSINKSNWRIWISSSKPSLYVFSYMKPYILGFLSWNHTNTKVPLHPWLAIFQNTHPY